jgi:hypothetical protein
MVQKYSKQALIYIRDEMIEIERPSNLCSYHITIDKSKSSRAPESSQRHGSSAKQSIENKIDKQSATDGARNSMDRWDQSVSSGKSRAKSQKELFELEREAFHLARAKNAEKDGLFQSDSDRIMSELCREQELSNNEKKILSSGDENQRSGFLSAEEVWLTQPERSDQLESTDFEIFGRFLDLDSDMPIVANQSVGPPGTSKTSRLGSLLGLFDAKVVSADQKLPLSSTESSEGWLLPTLEKLTEIPLEAGNPIQPKGLIRISTDSLFRKPVGNTQPSNTNPSERNSKEENQPVTGANRPASGRHQISASSKLQLQKLKKSSTGKQGSSGGEQKGMKKVDISSLFRPKDNPELFPPNSQQQVRVNQDASLRLLSQLKSNPSPIGREITHDARHYT